MATDWQDEARRLFVADPKIGKYRLSAELKARGHEVGRTKALSFLRELRGENVTPSTAHGDQFRGGSGIAGALSPLMLGDSRKRKRANTVHKTYDYLVLGHWHQDLDFKSIIASNALKGYDEYCYISNFDFSPPGGSWWLTDSRKGRTIKAPIFVKHGDEQWQQRVDEPPQWLRRG